MKTKKIILSLCCTILLVAFTGYVLLDTFVIERTYATVSSQSDSIAETIVHTENATSGIAKTDSDETTDNDQSVQNTEEAYVSDENTAENNNESSEAGNTADGETDGSSAENSAFTDEPVVTDTSYSDENIAITINEYQVYNTAVYVADVQVSSAEYLKTAFANDIFGRNVTATTSSIAEDNQAILAINGDFYGSGSSGYVLRNGVSYRDSSAGDQEDLVIYSDGSFNVINENETSLQELADAGAWQVLSFGPALVENGEIAVGANEEVGRAMASNPRTAIGIIDELHYVFVVSDGRTNESAGLSLAELAEVMQALGCSTAYNLDGGGSSTMVFNGQVINNPTTGHGIKERSVSDIVYIG